MLAIYKKEMQSYFTSMIAYLFMAVFVAVVGIYFTVYCVTGSVTDFAGYVLSGTSLWFAILIPLITMRLWSEEKKSKTDQLLLTSPISVGKIVAGKYLAVVSLFVLTLAIIMLFPFMLHFYGKVTWSTVMTGMLGYFLLGCALMAIGFFISTLTENQIVSAVITVVIIVAFYLLGSLANAFPGRARYSLVLCGVAIVGVMILYYVSTKAILPSVIFGVTGIGATALAYFLKPSIFDNGLSKFVEWFSVMDRFSNFAKGIIDIADVIYFVSFIGVFLFLTVRSVEKNRWN